MLAAKYSVTVNETKLKNRAQSQGFQKKDKSYIESLSISGKGLLI
jgi:hypothetical protein